MDHITDVGNMVQYEVIILCKCIDEECTIVKDDRCCFECENIEECKKIRCTCDIAKDFDTNEGCSYLK